ncbi:MULTISPECIES: hypothetical protein [Clostridium]|uniref:Uncharacterized protein n=1 Tax=Clostridium frigoriphilum TaxID=443253 RepID=A0ABU7UUG7_9CLOT|nr:hypothetical protein [Clostridium sp. DSM 17811]MBU3102027.1 hypothetical protein [Clostridium sp. DSM 17811]
MYVINNENGNSFRWDIGISNKNIKNDIIENKTNKIHLKNFRDAIFSIVNNEGYIFYTSGLFIYSLVVLGIFWNEDQLKKIKLIRVLLICISICLAYKIIMSAFDLKILFKNAEYYYYKIR